MFGLLTWVPGAYKILAKPTGGSSTALYCYAIWMRHLIKLYENGAVNLPKNVLEVGPGDSKGVGFAALISGSNDYVAVDAYDYTNIKTEVKIFDELVQLFREKAAIPNDDVFPRMRPKLLSYDFPHELFTDSYLRQVLNDKRIEDLRRKIINGHFANVHSDRLKTLGGKRFDFVLCQASLQYVEDIETFIAEIFCLSRKNAWISAVIDYSAHQTSSCWDEHWTMPKLLWFALKGRQPYFLSRNYHEIYEKCFQNKYGLLCVNQRLTSKNTIKRCQLAKEFESMSDMDLQTKGAFFLVKRR